MLQVKGSHFYDWQTIITFLTNCGKQIISKCDRYLKIDIENQNTR